MPKNPTDADNSEIHIDEIMLHPERFYKTPEELLKDVRLSARQKAKILNNWELEQKQILQASNENMYQDDPDGKGDSDAAKLLQAIHEIKMRLE